MSCSRPGACRSGFRRHRCAALPVHFRSFSIAASRSVPLWLRIFAHRSPTFFTRFSIVSIVKSCGFGRSCTSFHVSGVETPANALRARAVGARQRLALDVLQVVDVDGAVLAPPHHALDGGHLRMLRRHHRRDDLAEQHARFVRRARRQRDDRRAGPRTRRLRKALHLDAIELLLDPVARRRESARTSRPAADRDRSRPDPPSRDRPSSRTTDPSRSTRAAPCRAASSAIRRSAAPAHRRWAASRCARPAAPAPARDADRTTCPSTPFGNRFITSGRLSTTGRMNGAIRA